MNAAPRPPVVTVACVFVGFSAFLLLVQLAAALSDWGTIEMQDALEPGLTELNARGFDLTMGELLGMLRWAGLVGVLVLVAAVVFAIYAARGDQASRIGVTVLAVVTGLTLVTAGGLGLLLAFFLFFSGATLWSPDARRWYAARQDKAAPAEAAPKPIAESPAPVEPIAAWPAPAPTAKQVRRPPSVLAAGLVTVIGSSLAAGLASLYLLVYGLARDDYVQIIKDGPFADLYSTAEIETAMQAGFWLCLAMLPLAVAGLAAGLSLLARLRLGRAATLVLSWITAAGGVVLLPFGLLATGAAVTVIILLNRDESRAWK